MMNRRTKGLLLGLSTGLLLAGCGHETKRPPAAVHVLPAKAEARRLTPTLSVSDDLARACKLRVEDPKSAPKFAFDQADLLPGDRAVLDQIASCLTTGALKGQSIRLIGRADPRGETEYNMSLGAHRASGVADYLASSGLERARVDITSRGEFDATGTDETGWQADRRVDILLKSWDVVAARTTN